MGKGINRDETTQKDEKGGASAETRLDMGFSGLPVGDDLILGVSIRRGLWQNNTPGPPRTTMARCEVGRLSVEVGGLGNGVALTIYAFVKKEIHP